MVPTRISRDQAKTARKILGWTIPYIIKIAGISRATIFAFENGHRTLGWRKRAALRAAYESGGICFDDRLDEVYVEDESTPYPDDLGQLSFAELRP